MAQNCRDEKDKAERLHKSRYLRTWTDTEGAFRMDARLTPEAGAEVRAVLDVLRDDLFRESRRQRRNEPTQALDADALVEMARAARSGSSKKVGPKAVVNVTIDIKALNRGHANNGEVCEIEGAGPISVAAAQQLMTDSFLKLIFQKNGNVLEICHFGRYIPARVRTAVEHLYPECVVEGCHETKRLEFDHRIPKKKLGPISVENVVRLCRQHHFLKTYRSFELKRVKGQWKLEPPRERSPHSYFE
jgi:hypothetical protein